MITYDASTVERSQAHYDLFISYSRRDKPFVQNLHLALAATGQDIWVDWDDIPPVADWRQEIYRGIEAANNFIFIISPHSTASAVCGEELEHALKHGKRLIPIVWQEVSYEAVHSELAKLNWIFFREEDSFEEAMQKLLRAIATDLDYVRAHTRLVIQAHEWDSRERDHSFLLRGRGLAEAEEWLAEGERQAPQPTNLQRTYIQASRQVEIERHAAELRLRQISPQQYRNRQALLHKVRNFWIKGVLENSLHGRVLMALGMEARPEAIAHPWNISLEMQEQQPRVLAADIRIVGVFDQLGEGRTLLILGEPGAGKTTTLLELTRDLLVRAEAGLDHRIPVVFNLSSWEGGKQSIAQWVVAELNAKYQVPLTIGDAWLRNQDLLLLLDGLDEVRADLRDPCITALNLFQQLHGTEMVVCSRIKDYNALTQRLNFQAAVYVRSLTPDQIRHALNDTTADLAALRVLIETDTSLQELAKSPLMLNIMTLAYQGVSLENLPSLSLEERRQHLFNTYIDRMFKRREIKSTYTPADVRHWLSWLAQRLVQHSQTLFLIEEIQPTWLQNGFQIRRYNLGIYLVIGLCCGLYTGLLSEVINYNPNPETSSVLFRALPKTLLGFSTTVLVGVVLRFVQGVSAGAIAGLLTGFLHRIRSRLILAPMAGLLFAILTSLLGKLEIFNLEIFKGYALKQLDAILFAVEFGFILQEGNRVESVDTVRWSWTKARTTFGVGFGCGISAGLFLLLAKPILNGLNFTPQVCDSSRRAVINSLLVKILCEDRITWMDGVIGCLTLGLFVGAVISLIFGFQRISEVEGRSLPNQGIWRSLHNAITLSVLGGVLAGVLSTSTWWLHARYPNTLWWINYGDIHQPPDGVVFGVMVGAMVGAINWLVGGGNSGLTFLQHTLLRIILWKNGYAPWNYARFLDHATTLIFMQKVGGGYIFIHRLLLEHFAQMPLL